MNHLSIISKRHQVPATAQDFDDVLRVLNTFLNTLNNIVTTIVNIGDLNDFKADKSV